LKTETLIKYDPGHPRDEMGDGEVAIPNPEPPAPDETSEQLVPK
jgi:hypothetical protein